MKTLQKMSGLVNQYYILLIVGATALAMLFPENFSWAANYTSVFLAISMFCMGLTMTTKDFAEVLRKPWRVLLVELIQYLWMPLAGVLLVRLFGLQGEVALGLILVGSVPSGTVSNVMAYMANGDVPLSVSATSVSTLVAPITTPLLLSLWGSAYIEIPFWSMLLSIVQIVLIPIVLGLLTNSLFHSYIEPVKDILPSTASVMVLFVLLGVVAVNRDTILSSGLLMFAALFLHHMSGYIVALLACLALKFNQASTRSIMLEVSVQNTGLASSLGLQFFGANGALAGAVGSIVHMICGSLFAQLCKWHDKAKETKYVAPVTAKETEHAN